MQAVQWEDECGVVHVGKPAIIKHSGKTYLDVQVIGGERCQLIKHAHTGELEWVPNSLLKPYPSEPIPEPGK